MLFPNIMRVWYVQLDADAAPAATVLTAPTPVSTAAPAISHCSALPIMSLRLSLASAMLARPCTARPSEIMPDLDDMRIPVKYLANMLTGGKEAPIRLGLKRMMVMRHYMRSKHVEGRPDSSALALASLALAFDGAKLKAADKEALRGQKDRQNRHCQQ